MRKTILTLITLLLISCVPQKTKILFIGNSMLAMNNTVPGDISELTDEYEVDLYYSGGSSMKNHWEVGKALERIKSNNWDYIVLQESSFIPNIDTSESQEYLALFVEEIKKKKSKLIIYIPPPYHSNLWARDLTMEKGNIKMKEMVDNIDNYYSNLNDLFDPVALIPVAEVYTKYMNFNGTQTPDTVLHHEDMCHPSPLGTRLAALTVLETLGFDTSTLKQEDKKITSTIKEVVNSNSKYRIP